MRLAKWFALILSISCSQSAGVISASSGFVLAASTPCDADIRSILGIPADIKCDFIRWNLALDERRKTFDLDIRYGEAEPNTLGFRGGGEERKLIGEFRVSSLHNDRGKQVIYQLEPRGSGSKFSLLKLNENLFHVLEPGGRMMVGNGGWSYTLNRKEPVPNASALISTFSQRRPQSDYPQMVFDGRTPCQAPARLIGFPAAASCFKMKWRLTLYRDTMTLRPATFRLDSTLSREIPLQGKWSIRNGPASDPESKIYDLKIEGSGNSLSFLTLNDDQLFLLDKDGRLETGNADFSFTLDRRLDN